MKRFVFLLALAGILISISGCKKGDEDPSISLLSRKARLTGTWNLTEGKITTYSNIPEKVTLLTFTNTKKEGYDSTIYKYDGQMEYEIENNQVTDTTYYSLTYEFNKDGTFKQVEYFADIKKINEKWHTIYGIWSFMDGNRDIGVKNKERVLMEIFKYERKIVTHKEDGTTEIRTYSESVEGQGEMEVIRLKELTNSEIKIYYYTQEEYTNSKGDTEVFGYKGYMIFKQPEKK